MMTIMRYRYQHRRLRIEILTDLFHQLLTFWFELVYIDVTICRLFYLVPQAILLF